MPFAHLLSSCPAFSYFPQLPTSKSGPSGADSQVGGLVDVLEPCESSELSCLAGSSLPQCYNPHRLSQPEVFWGFLFPHWNIGLYNLSCSPLVPPSLFTRKCRTTCSTSCLASLPGFPSLPLLPVWMNVSSLTPWLLDFHTIWFSGSSDCFLFLNLLSFFWLCEEAKFIYLCLHLGWSPWDDFKTTMAPVHYAFTKVNHS